MKPKPSVNNKMILLLKQKRSVFLPRHESKKSKLRRCSKNIVFVMPTMILIITNFLILTNCVAIISESDNIRQVEPVNVNISFGNTEMKALVDSLSVCTIINRSLANTVVSNCQEIFGYNLWRYNS